MFIYMLGKYLVYVYIYIYMLGKYLVYVYIYICA